MARTVCVQRAGMAASWEAAHRRPVVAGDCRPPSTLSCFRHEKGRWLRGGNTASSTLLSPKRADFHEGRGNAAWRGNNTAPCHLIVTLSYNSLAALAGLAKPPAPRSRQSERGRTNDGGRDSRRNCIDGTKTWSSLRHMEVSDRQRSISASSPSGTKPSVRWPTQPSPSVLPSCER